MADKEKSEACACTPAGRVGAFHFPAARPGLSRYRLVAVLYDGSIALIRLGDSRRQVMEPPLPISDQIRSDVLGLRVERWEGILGHGRWEAVADLLTPLG